MMGMLVYWEQKAEGRVEKCVTLFDSFLVECLCMK